MAVLFQRRRGVHQPYASKKELDDMKSLTADTSEFFPSEFDSAIQDPTAIKQAFLRAAAASASQSGDMH